LSELLRIRKTPKGFVVLDLDTGNEVLCFRRRGKTYCFLRDIETKRFIVKITEFYIQYVGVIERCYPGGCRKGKGCTPTNNLHVECHVYEEYKVDPEIDIDDMIVEIDDMYDSLSLRCVECFDKYTGGIEMEPDVDQIAVRTVEAEEVCYFDRCE